MSEASKAASEPPETYEADDICPSCGSSSPALGRGAFMADERLTPAERVTGYWLERIAYTDDNDEAAAVVSRLAHISPVEAAAAIRKLQSLDLFCSIRTCNRELAWHENLGVDLEQWAGQENAPEIDLYTFDGELGWWNQAVKEARR